VAVENSRPKPEKSIRDRDSRSIRVDPRITSRQPRLEVPKAAADSAPGRSRVTPEKRIVVSIGQQQPAPLGELARDIGLTSLTMGVEGVSELTSQDPPGPICGCRPRQRIFRDGERTSIGWRTGASAHAGVAPFAGDERVQRSRWIGCMQRPDLFFRGRKRTQDSFQRDSR